MAADGPDIFVGHHRGHYMKRPMAARAQLSIEWTVEI
jgi:hypothetical protein